MDLLLRGGRVIDTASSTPSEGLPAHGAQSQASSPATDGIFDVRVKDGRIAEVGENLAARSGEQTLDCEGHVVTAGFVDLHVHFREPGHEYKEDIESGCLSAARGGFTSVCCMPNTKPINDCRAVTDLIVRRATEIGLARVFPIGAISTGLRGQALAEFGEMREAGIVAVSDDGRPVMNAALMRRALEYASTFGLPVVQHAEDLELAEGGVMNEGAVSTRLGLRGQPVATETTMVARDVELVEWTTARYHLAHVSAGRSVELVRDAKRRGLPVTCEVTPHHFTLTDEACSTYDPNMRVAPPLRSQRDVDAIIEGIVDGTIDCIATDHAPHSDVEKDLEFDCAACGMLGLETALPLALDLHKRGLIELARVVELLTSGPARIFGLDHYGIGSLAIGNRADITVFDPTAAWQVRAEEMASKSRNTPFEGRSVMGQTTLTLLGGVPTFDRYGLVSATNGTTMEKPDE